MAKIFITGSSDGLGLLAAQQLITEGHQVVLHARNTERKRQTVAKVPEAESVLIADLSSTDETKSLAAEANELGPFDAILHNAGVYQVSNKLICAVNTLAPYLLTCLIQRPKRVIYLSSGLHLQGDPSLKNLVANTEKINYSDSKLHVVLLTMAVARKWPEVYANAVNPGWVPTKMGGRGAPDDLAKGVETQAWLASSNEDRARVSGHYFYHKKEAHHATKTHDIQLQERFLLLCEQITGVHFPG